MDGQTQRCGSCREHKPSAQFPPRTRGRDGFWCRECRRAKYRASHPAPEPRITPEGVRCSRCKERKVRSEFYSKADSTPQHQCKACYREWNLGRYQPKGGATDEARDCAVCGKTYRPKQRRISKFCSRVCGAKERKESGRERDTYLLRTYGIRASDYDRMLQDQGGGCALCGIRPEELTRGRYRTYLHVDHDERTGEVRGLLCPDHNLLLGHWNHDPALLRRAAEYLEAKAST